MKKYLYTLLLILVSASAFAQVDTTFYGSVNDDPRYINLLGEYSSLVEQIDELRIQISEARDNYSEIRSDKSRALELENQRAYILNLEKEMFDMRSRSRQVVEDIACMEQSYIINARYSGDGVAVRSEYQTLREDNTEHVQLIQNSIIARSLSEGGYADLKQAQLQDANMPRLVEEYIATYKRMNRCVRAYNITTEEGEGEVVYDNYLALRDMADSLGGVIDSSWNYILNTKYYAYGYILERYGMYDLLDNSSADFSNMQQLCANEDGRYQLDALAHYALGRSTLVAFERDFAYELGLTMAADSLQRVCNAIVEYDYRLEPITLERKSFVEYEPLIFGPKDYYNEANPIPEVKVYQRGTIYRVLLGVFRNKQSNAVFKGAQPLYLTNDSEGYSYYVGGFATDQEAADAVEVLLDKGFKEPQICCWRDGKMRNLSEPEPEVVEAEVSQSTGNRYIVLLECSAISESMRATISAIAPEKRISRRGAGFAIGTFSVRSEAESLQTALLESYPNIEVSIVELNIQ